MLPKKKKPTMLKMQRNAANAADRALGGRKKPRPKDVEPKKKQKRGRDAHLNDGISALQSEMLEEEEQMDLDERGASGSPDKSYRRPLSPGGSPSPILPRASKIRRTGDGFGLNETDPPKMEAVGSQLHSTERSAHGRKPVS